MTIAVSKFGFRDQINTSVALTDGDPNTYWGFDNPSGVSNNSWIQLDFQYPVKLEFMRFLKNSGGFGDFHLVCSNTPATNGSDVVATGDRVIAYRDLYTGSVADSNYHGSGTPPDGTGVAVGQPNISYFSVDTLGKAYRYYRLTPIAGLAIASGILFQEIIPDYAVAIKVLGFPGSPTDSWKAVDGDLTTGWQPAAASFASPIGQAHDQYRVIPIGSPFVTLTELLPFIQFDFGEPVSLAALFMKAITTLAAVAAPWSATDLSTGHIVLTNSNYTAGSTGGGNWGVRGVASSARSTGKLYLEYSNIVSPGGSGVYGFATTSDSLGGGGSAGVTPGGFFNPGTGNRSMPSGPDGHVIGFAIDFDNLLMWATYDGTTWIGDGFGTPNPATGVHGGPMNGANLPLLPYTWLQNLGTSGSVTVNAGDNGAFTHTVPAGFAPWTASSVQASTGALGDCHLVASSVDCNDTAAAWNSGPPPQNGDVDIGQALRASISAGHPLVTNLIATDKYRYYRLVFGANAGPNGDEILEFNFAIASEVTYANSDYDSIFSRGDRIANGLMSTGVTFSNISGAASHAFDNNFGSSPANTLGISSGGTLNAGDQWWWDFGAYAFELNGLAFPSANGAETTAGTWRLVGGLDPTSEWPTSYANEFAETSWAQAATFDPAAPDVVEFTPAPKVAWHTYAFVNTTTHASYGGTWLADEMWLKLRHSSLDGGDRNGSVADKHVIMTTSSGISAGTVDSTHGAYTVLLDGVYDYQNAGTGHAKVAPCFIQATSGGGGVNTAGQFLEFQYPRNVTPNHIVFVRAAANTQAETYSGATPQHYGLWHWECSDDGTTFVQVGGSWSFTEACEFMTAPRLPAAVQGTVTNKGFDLDTLAPDGHLYWRMVLETGPAFGSANPIAQIMFNLTDKENQSATLLVSFTDDASDGFSFSTTDFTAPGNAFAVPLSDDVNDGFGLATLTLTKNALLRFDIDDGGDFEAFSQDLLPSIVTQTVVVVTGT